MPQWSVLSYLKESPEGYREVLKRRGKSPEQVDRVLLLEKEYKETLNKTNKLRHKLNILSRKGGSLSYSEKEEAKLLKTEIKIHEQRLRKTRTLLTAELFKLPNLLHKSVPDGFSEEENVPIKYVGTPKVWTRHVSIFLEETERGGTKVYYEEIDWKPKGHAHILEDILKRGDTLQAARVASSRFYYIFDDIAWLDFALSLYTIDYMTRKGYRFIIPPYMLRGEIMNAAIDFKSFKEMIYKIEDEDLFLIGTPEYPLLGMLKEKIIEEDELPIKLVGWSPCFRKEAGAHGKDTKGIFRVHQFHKIEQFIFSYPDENKSMNHFFELVGNAEELWRGLGIPYRTVNVCAGELGDHAYIKYDIEAWFPAQGRYREVAPISNCLDWQAYRGDIIFRDKRKGKMKYVYTLNGTAIPTTRAICAILENYQQEDGSIKIPQCLRRYLQLFEKAPTDVIVPP